MAIHIRIGRDQGSEGAAQDLKESESKLAAEYFRAEFTGLRAEIDRRSNAQQGLLVLYVTGVGIASTVAVEAGAKALSLLLLPFASLAFASLFIDHHEAIGRIGIYLRMTSHRLAGDEQTWEEWVHANEALEPRRVTWRTAPFTIFLGTSLAVLAGTIPVALVEPMLTTDASRTAVRVAWLLGCVAFLLTWHRLRSLRPQKTGPQG